MDDKQKAEIADQWSLGTDKDGNVWIDAILNGHKRAIYLDHKEVTVLARLLTALAACPEWIVEHDR